MKSDLTGLKCLTCRGDLVAEGDILRCGSCGNIFPRGTVRSAAGNAKGETQELTSELIQNLNAASNLHMLGHFDDASQMYEAITRKYPDEIYAYWGAFLAEYGVQYVEDGKEFKPVCHRLSRIPATQSLFLKKLYEKCADERDIETYRMKADKVETIRYRAYEISLSLKPYDVFLCQNGNPADCTLKLAAELKKKGLNVFLPQKDIPYGEDGEAYVFGAIQSAPCMLVIANSLDDLEQTYNTWERFISIEGKRIQVLHDNLNESAFPSKLRRVVQLQAPISLRDIGWLESAVRFVGEREKKENSLEELQRLRSQQEAQGRMLTEIMQSHFMPETNNLEEAFVALLAYIAQGELSGADSVYINKLVRFASLENGESVQMVAELCIEFLRLTKAQDAMRRSVLAKIGTLAEKLKTVYPLLTEKERKIYPYVAQAKRAGFLLYLAKCFGAIKDTERQCFVLDLVESDMALDLREINDLLVMLFSVGREDEVRELMTHFPNLDGDHVLPLFLKKFSAGTQKQMVLMSVAEKIVCSENIADELNDYLAECGDVGVCLAVVEIMTRNHLKLTASGLSGVLSQVKERSQVVRILENFGSRPLSGMEVDMLVSIGTNSNEAAIEVLRHLRFRSGVTDLGSANMSLFITKCNLDVIKTSLFEFALDKKLAEKLFIETMRSGGEDRLSTISVLSGFVPSVGIESYSQLLLSKDVMKKDILRIVVPKTGKYASANNVLSQYLAGSDSDEDKREIFNMFGDFPFNASTLERYLAIYPPEYDETYEKWLFAYLAENAGQARTVFTTHYEKLIGGYQRVLPKIFERVQYFGNDAIVRFVMDFRGDQATKDALFLQMKKFLEKPKKIEVTVKNTVCNLLQAYMLTLRGSAPSIRGVVSALEHCGLKLNDKVIFFGKKTKWADYLQAADLGEEIRLEIVKYS